MKVTFGIAMLLAFTISNVEANLCNKNEYVIVQSKDVSKYTAERSTNRCAGTKCLYHTDCESAFCLKKDSLNQADIEGICVPKID